MEDKLYLIYIHLIGYSHNGTGIYEFIFTENPYNINYSEWNWLEIPIKGNAIPPENGYFDKIVRFELDRFKLILLSESTNTFKYFDGFDDIIALAWEDDENNLELESDTSTVKRLVFRYGDSFKSVSDKFYARDIIFNK